MTQTLPRIALVRGHHLSKEETVSYELLRNEYSFHCFSTTNPWFDHSDIVFPITYLPSVEGLFRSLPGGLATRTFGFADNLLGTGQWMPGLEKALRGFDIVHTSDYCHLFTWQAARAKRHLGYRLAAIHYENIPFSRTHKPLVRATRRIVYDEVDLFLAMSERAREALVLEGIDRGKIAVIGNAVDTTKFRPRTEERVVWRNRYGILPGDLLILFVGRIRASKGIFDLIYAMKKLVDDPDINRNRLRLLVIGQGPAEQEVRNRVRSLALDHNVILGGPVPHNQIHLVHSCADIFALPSSPRRYWQEQFGIVLIESMACAVPIVSTLSGSIPEVVGDAGLLVQPNDHYSLFLALKSLVTSPERRADLGRRALARVDAVHSLPVVADRLRAAYRSLLHRP
jgi:glycosyltransferase involved in cell wall biosynthesis